MKVGKAFLTTMLTLTPKGGGQIVSKGQMPPPPHPLNEAVYTYCCFHCALLESIDV